jgi:putative Holliday junction resolvase
MRIMGLDVGAMTVGVAVSDELLCIAQGLEVIRRKQENKLRQTYARIEELAVLYEVKLIVIGYPKNMNNTVGDRAQKCEAFAEDIKRRTGIPTLLWDERLTTVTAQRVLDLAEVSLEKKRAVVDKIAAAVILQNYLDYRANCGDGKDIETAE